MPAPTTRPVHPCVVSIFEGNRGAEYSAWAYITTVPPHVPNLVTAQASTIRIYELDEASGKLIQCYAFTDLAGNICYLGALPATTTAVDATDATEQQRTRPSDSLLVGFCGHPRLTLVSLQRETPTSPAVLSAMSLVDLTQALIDHSYGSVTPLEQDMVVSTVTPKNSDTATVGIILGGGVAVACLNLHRFKGSSSGDDDATTGTDSNVSSSGWIASEPFLLPLATLQASIQSTHATSKSQSATAGTAAVSQANVASMATGFGDVLSTAFLSGYNEPTMAVLHSNVVTHGRVWSGRLGRPRWQPGTRYGMIVTAVSVTVAHRRSAVLWSVEVPIDAISVHPVGHRGCLVICVNAILFINNAGRMEDFLAVNGYVRSTCPTKLLDMLQPNPKPFPKLAIQLDGATVAFCSDRAMFLSLRGGDLYLLQLGDYSVKTLGNQHSASRMSLAPLGRTLAGSGTIESLIAWPLATASITLYDKLGSKMAEKEDTPTISMGLLFAGSRLGDSYFLGYALENMVLPSFWGDSFGSGPGKKIKVLENETSDSSLPHEFDRLAAIPSLVSPEDDEILRIEEEALYAPSSTTHGNKKGPNVIPPSDGEDSDGQGEALTLADTGTKRKLAPVTHFSVLQALTALDTLVGLGPVGPSCEGPIMPPLLKNDGDAPVKPVADTIPGASALVVPCGYGSSGGLGIITVPGRDERAILSEVDCLGVHSIFSLRSLGLVLMGKAGGGIRIMRLQTSPEKNDVTSDAETVVTGDLIEVKPDEDTKSATSSSLSLHELFLSATLLSCAEFADGNFALVFSSPVKEDASKRSYGVAVLKEAGGQFKLSESFSLPASEERGSLLSASPVTGSSDKSLALMFVCTWSSGVASLVTFDGEGILDVFDFPGGGAEDSIMRDADDDSAMNAHYSSRRILAVDLFRAPSNFFQSSSQTSINDKISKKSLKSSKTSGALADDTDLYYVSAGSSDTDSASKGFTTKESSTKNKEDWGGDDLFVGLCRQNGDLEVYACVDLSSPNESIPVWSATGCSHGITALVDGGSRNFRLPRQHRVSVRELRFFCCGPTPENDAMTAPTLSRPLCLALETNAGDLFIYAANARNTPENSPKFTRVPLKLVSRESQEQTRFQAKMKRKGIMNECATEDVLFQHNKLHRFHSLSGQDGLFAAVTRPLWLVSERGVPVPIAHRSRHAAPSSGGIPPVCGFCSDLNGVGAYLTIHARVGRHGSQRLTLYRDITPAFSTEGLLPGGGVCFEKVHLGVTVRRIEFIDDVSVSGRGRCLYAMLVSRESEVDMSHLNEDGMSAEERDRVEQEKESAKIQRQVEADLGGFDVNLEYVEEIEREDCFEVDKELGGAPPLPQHTYAVWIVDAAKNWAVVDSYELGEFDHGMTMKIMSLTDFKEDPTRANTTESDVDDLEDKLFITVGVGIVDKDGEDVTSKGRVLMFNLITQDTLTTQSVELSLACEKNIFHGPVTSLTCLSSEGKNRLIIGAGADINVEQWGNGKLTQVGFFRATMQVLDIFMFKNFLLLSDAYDSLYFLVWRESDKSLTLLSKDYDPLVVYAAGTMSRGGSLTFVCHDDRQNLQFFQYAPGEAAARGGNKLVSRADFHLGAQTSAFRNHPCRSSLWINSASPSSTLTALKQQDNFFGRSDDDQRLGVHFGTSDGGFQALVPLSEPVYWRLAALQSVMANALESDCALSHRAWRLYRRSYRRGGCRSTARKKGVIDGDLVSKYADLPLSDQEDLASSIGTTVGLILDNILELNCAKSPVL